MHAKPETLTAIYLEESHRWETTAILRCEVRAESTEKKPVLLASGDVVYNGVADPFFDTDDEVVTVKAYDCEEGEFEPNLPYTFYGKWEEYTRKANKWNPKPTTELQFHARKWRKVRPYDKTGVIKWLRQCPGIKEGIARRLWEAYGADAIARLKDAPEEVATEIGGGFTEERARMAAAHLVENDAMEAAFVDLASLLDGRGMPHTLPKKLVRDYGADAADDVKHNPWLLLAYKSTGVSRVDKLYLDLGGNPAAIKRQAIILWKCLVDAGNTTGDTWQREAAAEEMLRGRIAGAEVKFQKAVELAVRGKLIARRWTDDFQVWLAEEKRANHEKYIAQRVAEMMAESRRWPLIASDAVLSDEQLFSLNESTRASIGALTGGPGTGKTTTLAVLLREAIRQHGIQNIAAASPTGKAAVRMGESLQECGIDLRATTIHSLLSVTTTPEVDGWGFKHDENDPLPYKFICIDESSMLDTALMAALLRATAKGTCIQFVGDCGQLPPVGPGAPLRDMIAAGVPTGNLQTIYRNAGTVVRACKAIRDGTFSRFDLDDRFQLEPSDIDPDSPHNAKIVTTRGNADSAKKIVEFLRALKGKTILVNLKDSSGPRRHIDLLRDVQVIVATNGIRSGISELSRMEMNKRLQKELNPTGATVAGSVIRTGDKIIGTKNGYMPIVDDDSPYYDPASNQVDLDDTGEKVRVCNGEIGWCIGQEEKIIYARFECPLRIFKIPRGKQENDDGSDEEKTVTGCSFDLGYAITAHRSQGSQFPIVLFGIDESPGARMVLSREAVYTILSRMQWFVALFGKRPTLDNFCKRLALAPRKTFLEEEILEAVERRERK